LYLRNIRFNTFISSSLANLGTKLYAAYSLFFASFRHDLPIDTHQDLPTLNIIMSYGGGYGGGRGGGGGYGGGGGGGGGYGGGRGGDSGGYG
jgi:hypothetical protein